MTPTEFNRDQSLMTKINYLQIFPHFTFICKSKCGHLEELVSLFFLLLYV